MNDQLDAFEIILGFRYRSGNFDILRDDRVAEAPPKGAPALIVENWSKGRRVSNPHAS